MVFATRAKWPYLQQLVENDIHSGNKGLLLNPRSIHRLFVPRRCLGTKIVDELTSGSTAKNCYPRSCRCQLGATMATFRPRGEIHILLHRI